MTTAADVALEVGLLVLLFGLHRSAPGRPGWIARTTDILLLIIIVVVGAKVYREIIGVSVGLGASVAYVIAGMLFVFVAILNVRSMSRR